MPSAERKCLGGVRKENNVHVPSASMFESVHTNVHVPTASMFESIHAGQDSNVHAPTASMIASIHVGQYDNAHVPSAFMFESTHAGQDNSAHVLEMTNEAAAASARHATIALLALVHAPEKFQLT